jgi:exodeoxyribonuclease III
VRVLTWNLRHGGGSGRMPEITLSLLEHRADVVVLTEWRKHTGGQICGILADHGLQFQHSTDPAKGSNGVLIASRRPVHFEAPHDDFMGLPREGATGLAAHTKARKKRLVEANIPELGVTIIGVHIPPDGPNSGREAVFQAAVATARARRAEHCIMIGDFNAGRHFLDEEGATFTCTRLLGELASIGYEDAWRKLNPQEREFSWFSHEGKGFRIDHALVSGSLSRAVTACWYSHSERERNLSDHSLMLLSVDVPVRNS